jgi:hypothetical protein
MSYRARLRIEGFTLAACGLVGSVVLVALVAAARENVVSTLVQLAVVAALLSWFGPRAARGWGERAEVVDAPGGGEPTPLWQLPAICAVLALGVGLPTGAWDASLRVTAGCALVGLAQGVLLERAAAAVERRRGGWLVRLPGSRIVRGTRLGLVREGIEPD